MMARQPHSICHQCIKAGLPCGGWARTWSGCTPRSSSNQDAGSQPPAAHRMAYPTVTFTLLCRFSVDTLSRFLYKLLPFDVVAPVARSGSCSTAFNSKISAIILECKPAIVGHSDPDRQTPLRPPRHTSLTHIRTRNRRQQQGTTPTPPVHRASRAWWRAAERRGTSSRGGWRRIATWYMGLPLKPRHQVSIRRWKLAEPSMHLGFAATNWWTTNRAPDGGGRGRCVRPPR